MEEKERKDIKRVLWVDDYPNNKVSTMFFDVETKKVSTMDDAIDEISGSHLYDYDTIVFDIDFENGLPTGEKNVIKKLSEKIYLNEKQREDRNFIINYGGYLLFLYLLEKGYPSEQVAFLTGNTGIIGQLQTYTIQNLKQLSKKEIVEQFISIWENCDGDIDSFCEQIYSLPIDIKYRDEDNVLNCAEALESEKIDELKELIEKVEPSMVTGSIQNTGDMMIFKFHEANLEPPVYFSKNDNDIDGHNRIDAEYWLKSRRSADNVTRWLLLDAANYVEWLFQKEQGSMEMQVGSLFMNINTDPGVRSSFQQMYFVFDGLCNIQRRGIYYQAISAMLIPFDSDTESSGSYVDSSNLQYNMVRKMFARLSKQMRNYCAHNYFGSSLTNESVLYVIACTLLAVLSKDQCKDDKLPWFENMYAAVSPKNNYVIATNVSDVDTLCQELLDQSKIDTYHARVENKPYSSFSATDILRTLGYNQDMSTSSQPNTGIREKYCIYTLAAYVVKWFNGLSEEDVENKFGSCVSIIYKISNEIVADYQYPLTI